MLNLAGLVPILVSVALTRLVQAGKSGRGEKVRSSSKERRRGSKESLTDSVHYEGEDNPGIKTKIFHALGLNS